MSTFTEITSQWQNVCIIGLVSLLVVQRLRIYFAAPALQRSLKALKDPRVEIRSCKIMTPPEYKVFKLARQALWDGGHKGWHVFAQVSLGELFSAWCLPDKSIRDRAFYGFNDKRCDIAITDAFGVPKLMIEYNGKKHNGWNCKIRDEIKRTVCAKAGVPVLEIVPDQSDKEIRERIMERLGVKK